MTNACPCGDRNCEVCVVRAETEWALTVPCNRCGKPSGVPADVLKANRASDATCAACAQTMTVDP